MLYHDNNRERLRRKNRDRTHYRCLQQFSAINIDMPSPLRSQKKKKLFQVPILIRWESRLWHTVVQSHFLRLFLCRSKWNSKEFSHTVPVPVPCSMYFMNHHRYRSSVCNARTIIVFIQQSRLIYWKHLREHISIRAHRRKKNIYHSFHPHSHFLSLSFAFFCCALSWILNAVNCKTRTNAEKCSSYIYPNRMSERER